MNFDLQACFLLICLLLCNIIVVRGYLKFPSPEFSLSSTQIKEIIGGCSSESVLMLIGSSESQLLDFSIFEESNWVYQKMISEYNSTLADSLSLCSAFRSGVGFVKNNTLNINSFVEESSSWVSWSVDLFDEFDSEVQMNGFSIYLLMNSQRFILFAMNGIESLSQDYYLYIYHYQPLGIYNSFNNFYTLKRYKIPQLERSTQNQPKRLYVTKDTQSNKFDAYIIEKSNATKYSLDSSFSPIPTSLSFEISKPATQIKTVGNYAVYIDTNGYFMVYSKDLSNLYFQSQKTFAAEFALFEKTNYTIFAIPGSPPSEISLALFYHNQSPPKIENIYQSVKYGKFYFFKGESHSTSLYVLNSISQKFDLYSFPDTDYYYSNHEELVPCSHGNYNPKLQNSCPSKCTKDLHEKGICYNSNCNLIENAEFSRSGFTFCEYICKESFIPQFVRNPKECVCDPDFLPEFGYFLNQSNCSEIGCLYGRKLSNSECICDITLPLGAILNWETCEWECSQEVSADNSTCLCTIPKFSTLQSLEGCTFECNDGYFYSSTSNTCKCIKPFHSTIEDESNCSSFECLDGYLKRDSQCVAYLEKESVIGASEILIIVIACIIVVIVILYLYPLIKNKSFMLPYYSEVQFQTFSHNSEFEDFHWNTNAPTELFTKNKHAIKLGQISLKV